MQDVNLIMFCSYLNMLASYIYDTDTNIIANVILLNLLCGLKNLPVCVDKE